MTDIRFAAPPPPKAPGFSVMAYSVALVAPLACWVPALRAE
jgi:hypothetical protein